MSSSNITSIPKEKDQKLKQSATASIDNTNIRNIPCYDGNIQDSNFQQLVGSLAGPSLLCNPESANHLNSFKLFKLNLTS